MGCFESKPEPAGHAPKPIPAADGSNPASGEAVKSAETPKDKNKELAIKAFGFAKKAYAKKKGHGSSGHGGGHGGGHHGGHHGGHGGHEEHAAEEEEPEFEDE